MFRVIAVLARAQRLAAEGHDIINLGIGQPDFKTPPHVVEAAVKALQEGRIAAAGLDVFEQEPVDPNNPLLKMDNVAVTNHYASYSEVAWERGNTQLGEEAVRIALGQWPMSLINPDVRSTAPPREWPKEWKVIAAEAGKS